MSLIWEDAYLARLAADGEQDIVNRVACLFHRYAINIVADTSLYTLPVKTSRIRRVTWKGVKLDPITFDDLCLLNPNYVWVDVSNKVDIPTGKPQFYVLHPTNINDIRFYPCPNVTITYDNTDVYGAGIEANVIISCFRNIDDSAEPSRLPDYIYRRAVKAYVLWKAFLQEGKGQNIVASNYYKSKYEYYVLHFDKLNSDTFVSKKYALSGNQPVNRMPARPVLPSRYGVE